MTENPHLQTLNRIQEACNEITMKLMGAPEVDHEELRRALVDLAGRVGELASAVHFLTVFPPER